ncbi:MAG TPA: 2Fe-2S iron-sulfur cluster-binding protein [Planctomycetota bacterium]|nr:2Fe-2S iron-sulfur cluster-binding protein [Planctomycetota bacterium]
MTKIILNGHEIEVDPKQPLIRACHDHGVAVPMYCYHPGLTPVGSCRICQVEVKLGEAPPRVVVACRTPVAEGMVVDTEAAKAHDARREVLEFLLKNHPLDCPICDKAGECDLQDYAFVEGQAEGRSSEPRRKLEKRKSLGDVIVLDEERCILCSRCVRFFEEVTKKPQLTVSGLGARSVISTFMDRPLTGNYQGNLADICPVGALTTKEFRFQARVWNLSKSLSTCGECSRGCAITVEVLRSGVVKRVRPRYDHLVNQWWMCDVGRFALEGHNLPSAADADLCAGRLEGAALRGYSGLERAPLEDALEVAADALAGRETYLVLSPDVTQEQATAALALAETLGAAACFVSPPPNGLADDLLHTGDPCANRKGLEMLGVEGLGAEQALERLAGAQAALLVGVGVGAYLGEEGLAALSGDLRLVQFDLVLTRAAALTVGVGVPDVFETIGHRFNVDGVRRELAPARPMPSGVEPLERSLGALRARVAARTTEAAG